MVRLICTGITSLDGYIADETGKFDWSRPDEDVHSFVNDLERPIGTYLYGRRLYEVMVYWETAHTEPDQPPFVLDYASVWQAADKVVYSTTLESVTSAGHRRRGQTVSARQGPAEP
jgi:RibD C-terminal domain